MPVTSRASHRNDRSIPIGTTTGSPPDTAHICSCPVDWPMSTSRCSWVLSRLSAPHGRQSGAHPNHGLDLREVVCIDAYCYLRQGCGGGARLHDKRRFGADTHGVPPGERCMVRAVGLGGDSRWFGVRRCEPGFARQKLPSVSHWFSAIWRPLRYRAAIMDLAGCP